jgi:hypothetical protein
MDAANLERRILEVIGDRQMTTAEIESALARTVDKCPDDLFRRLNVLRKKGLVSGGQSAERGAWVWWIQGA